MLCQHYQLCSIYHLTFQFTCGYNTPSETNDNKRFMFKQTGCGGILTGRRGSIQTPDYPAAYKENLNCEWKIKVQEQYSVNIKKAVINLPPPTQLSCNKDVVLVREGTNSSGNLLLQLCGTKEYNNYNSEFNSLFITFQSDTINDGANYKGAIAEYNTGKIF